MRAIPKNTLDAELIMNFNDHLNRYGYLDLDDEEVREIKQHSTREAKEAAFQKIYNKRYAEKVAAFKILNGMGGVKHSQRTSKTKSKTKKPFPRKIDPRLRRPTSFMTATFSPQVAILRRYALWLKEIHGIDTPMDEDDEELLLRQHDDDSREAVFVQIVEKHKRQARLRNAGKKRTKSRKTSKKRRSRTR
jgi:hypothetical protein